MKFKNFTKALVNSQKGMSLIEILIALTLLALAGTFISGKVMDSLYEGKLNSAKIQMQGIAERLKEFRRHCNFYPTTDQGLQALVEKPTTGRECKRYQPGGYIDGGQVPLDPWDADFIYESDGKTFNILSYGQDNMEGGEEKDADISLYDKK